MSKVVAIMSMSLDGFVADPADGVAEVFDWYFQGDVEVNVGGADSGGARSSCRNGALGWGLGAVGVNGISLQSESQPLEFKYVELMELPQ